MIMAWMRLPITFILSIAFLERVISGGLELPFKHGMRMGRSFRLSNGKLGQDLFPEGEVAQNMIVQRLNRFKVKIAMIKNFGNIKNTLGIFGGEPKDWTRGAQSLEGPGREYLKQRPEIQNPRVLEVLVNLEYHVWVERLGKDAILHFPSERRLIGQYYVDSLIHGGQLVISFIWHLKNEVSMSKIEKSVQDIISKNKNGDDLDYLVQIKESLRQETRMIMINSFVSKGIPRPLIHFDNIQRVVNLFKSEVSKMNRGRGVPMRVTLRSIPEIALVDYNQEMSSKHLTSKTEDENMKSTAEIIKKNIKPIEHVAVENFYKDLRDAQVTFIGLVRSLNTSLKDVGSLGKSELPWTYDKEIEWITKEKKLISDEISSLKKDFLDVREQLEKYTNKEGSEFEPDVIEQLYAMMKKLIEIEKDLQKQRGKCKKLVPTAWFTASLSDTWDKEGETIIYDVVTSNHGNIYDNTSGVITAPAHGLYAITYVIPFTNDSQPVIEMKKTRRNSKGKDENTGKRLLEFEEFTDKEQSDVPTFRAKKRSPRSARETGQRITSEQFQEDIPARTSSKNKRSLSVWKKALQNARQKKNKRGLSVLKKALQNDRQKKGKSKKSRTKKSKRGKSKKNSPRKRRTRNSRSKNKGSSKRSRGSKSKSRRKPTKRSKTSKKQKNKRKKENSRKSRKDKITNINPLKVIRQPLIINVDGTKQQMEGENSRNSVLLVLSAGDKIWMELTEGTLQSEGKTTSLSAVLLKIEQLD